MNEKEQPVEEKKEEKKEEKNSVLDWAWNRFALYESNSDQLKKNFSRFQIWILVLGALTTLLALSQAQLGMLGWISEGSRWHKVFQYTIVAFPVIVSVLIAASNRFKPGGKYVLLRSAAEGIKREIFSYRVRAAYPGSRLEGSEEQSNDEILVAKVNQLSAHLMQTEVNSEGLAEYTGTVPPQYSTAQGDDGFGPLTIEDYMKFRLTDQANYYLTKTRKLSKKQNKLYWAIIIFGGLGTLLAAVGLELWVAMTASLVGVYTTYMEYQQIDNTIVLQNQTMASLSEIRSGWEVLPADAKTKPERILGLVDKSENVLMAEHSKWLQQMEDAMASLREKNEEESKKIKAKKEQAK